MNDTISRQQAINALLEMYCKSDEDGYVWIIRGDACKRIDALPFAQPEREKGKWIYGEDEYGIDGYRCDKCGFFVLWDYGHNFINYIGNYNFCPSCGADMRGETGC